MKDFSILAAPLTEVIKKSVGFHWGKDQEEAFTLLKERLCTTLVFITSVILIALVPDLLL